MNRDNALWTLEQNKRLQQEQRVYDSPSAQMERYKAAGLNPHLIYGNGSSAGSAFPIAQQGIAPSRIDAPDAAYPDVAGTFLSAGQTLAQTELAAQKANESEANQALKAIQLDIAKTNPMLDPQVYKWVTRSMSEIAELKAQEAIEMKKGWTTHDGESMRLYAAKLHAEVEATIQRLGLNTTDLEIKNKILESKEFENAIKQIEKNWLENGDYSPEHVRQGLMLFLSKMAR